MAINFTEHVKHVAEFILRELQILTQLQQKPSAGWTPPGTTQKLTAFPKPLSRLKGASFLNKGKIGEKEREMAGEE